MTRHDVQRRADDIAAGKTAVVIKAKPRGLARIAGGAGSLLGGIFYLRGRRNAAFWLERDAKKWVPVFRVNPL